MLNTHHHTDHVGGDGEILARGIEIIAHRNIRENILKNKQPGAPRVVFSDQAEVHLGGAEVQMTYLGRGHTNGDTVIYFPDLRTVHTGDLIIDGMPVIDYNNGGSALEFVNDAEQPAEDRLRHGDSRPRPRADEGLRPRLRPEARDDEQADGGSGEATRAERSAGKTAPARRHRLESHRQHRHVHAQHRPVYDEVALATSACTCSTACSWNRLAETAARLNQWEFLLIVAPPQVPGSTAAIVNPLALF